MNKIWIIGMMIAVIALVGCSTEDQMTGNAVTDSEGDPASGGKANDNPDKVTVYFFWGDGCPHCVKEKSFLEEIEEKYPEIEVKSLETWKDPENVELLQEMAQAYGFQARGVPTTFIGEEHWVGFSERMEGEMEQKIEECIDDDCVNPGDRLN